MWEKAGSGEPAFTTVTQEEAEEKKEKVNADVDGVLDRGL